MQVKRLSGAQDHGQFAVRPAQAAVLSAYPEGIIAVRQVGDADKVFVDVIPGVAIAFDPVSVAVLADVVKVQQGKMEFDELVLRVDVDVG